VLSNLESIFVLFLAWAVPIAVLWVFAWLLYRLVRASERIASAQEVIARTSSREVAPGGIRRDP
jgi:hypothetical protein